MNMDIPTYADIGVGYFDTIEIKTIMSLLQIIDNPLQDIPLLAVLKSPMFGFTPEELIDIRLEDKEKSFYEALEDFAYELSLIHISIQRFKGNKELHHLERYYSAYPYKVYEEETKNIHIKEFNNSYSEVEEIAREIVHLVRDKKVRYKDITIATRDLNRYDFLVHSIFNEYNIPNFIDKKRRCV